MFQALFLHLEGGFEREDRVTMLYGHDAACRKGSAVTNAVHLVNDRHLGVARPHEIPVQGMDMAIRLDGTLRRDQRLGYGLSAEDALPIQIGAATTEQVVFQPLQVENAKQFVHCRHAASPFGRAAGFRTGYGGRQEAERRLRQRTSFPQVNGGVPMTDHASKLDILIAGAGYVGLAAAVSLKQARPNLDIAIVDAAPEGSWQKDNRASAIAAAACRMLERLGVWEAVSANAQAMTEMVITDSRTGDPVRPVFLTFSGEVAPGEPFAHMIANRDLNGALRAEAARLGIDVIEGVAVQGFDANGGGATVHLADGATLRTRLLVAADGVRSRLRDMAGIQTVKWDYGQSGIVCTVEHERPHNGRAEEHFLPAGPFAILPLKPSMEGRNRSLIVWSERAEEAERLVNGDDLLFEAELERRFGLRLGEIRVADKPHAWPLGLTLARAFVAPRFALAGDAAHGIHPIAGQGMNLGFRDVAALAEVIVEADRLGQDIGALDVLERYQQWRRFDTVQMGIMTDVLNRLFSNDIAPVRAVRDFGLGLVERMPRLKNFFIRQASGLAGNTPRLLRGEAI